MSLEILALLDLPLEGQVAILQSGKADLLRSLSCNPKLASTSVEQILKSKDSSAVYRALRITNDANQLTRESIKGYRAISILGNPNTPVEILVENLTSQDAQRALASFTNSATPLSEKESRLTPELASSMVEVKGNVGDQVVRAYALLERNEYIANNPKIWPRVVRRAIAGSNKLTTSMIEEIRTAGWMGWESFRNHPINRGLALKDIDTRLLPGFHSSASDLEALERVDLDYHIAREITTRSRVDAEPNVIAKLVDRFGIKILASAHPIAGTRIKSAAWLTPAVNYCQKLDLNLVNELENAITILGGNEEAWQSFIKLYPEWNQSASELAQAVCKL